MSSFDQSSELFMPVQDTDISNLSLIHALRANSDQMKRVADQQDRMSSKMDAVGNVVHDIDKRLAIIEGNSLASAVKDHDERLAALEASEQRRAGAVGLWDFMLKSWPAVLGFLVLLVGLAVTGRINL